MQETMQREALSLAEVTTAEHELRELARATWRRAAPAAAVVPTCTSLHQAPAPDRPDSSHAERGHASTGALPARSSYTNPVSNDTRPEVHASSS